MKFVAVALAALGLACGGDDIAAPYTPPPPDCPEVDDYLRPLYALVDAGQLANLARAVRVQLPEDARRDLIDGLLRLAGAFEDGSFSALATLPPPDANRPGLQKTLGKVLRWLTDSGPGAPYAPLTAVLGRALATCEGGPVFGLLRDAVADPDLLSSLGDLLGGSDLAGALSGLDFEGANGRSATQYLVRNLFVSASSPSFSVERVIDLLGLLIDLEAPPYDKLSQGLRRVLDADGLPALQSLLVCLGDVDPDLALGGFGYDLLTSGLLAELIPPPADPASPPSALLPEPLRKLLSAALGHLADDALTRRALTPALLILLSDAVATPVLRDAATLLEAEALGGLLDALTDIASGACR